MVDLSFDPIFDPSLHHYSSNSESHIHSNCIPSASTRAYPIVDPSVYPSFAPTFVSRLDSRFIHMNYNALFPSLHSCLFTRNHPESLSNDS